VYSVFVVKRNKTFEMEEIMRLNIGGYDVETDDYTISIDNLAINLDYTYSARDEKVFGVGGDYEIDKITTGKIEYNYTDINDTEEKFEVYDSFSVAPEWIQNVINDEIYEERVELAEKYSTSWEN
jgi:hypothetical protein